MTAVLITSFVVAGLLLLIVMMARPRPVDDALALRLAADLGAGAPTFVTDGDRREWRIELDDRTELFVGEYGVRVRRALDRPISGCATVLAGPLHGREQYDYGIARYLIPSEDGLVVGGHPGRPLEEWERKLPADLTARMGEAELGYLAFDYHSVATGRPSDVRAEWVTETSELLAELAEDLA